MRPVRNVHNLMLTSKTISRTADELTVGEVGVGSVFSVYRRVAGFTPGSFWNCIRAGLELCGTEPHLLPGAADARRRLPAGRRVLRSLLDRGGSQGGRRPLGQESHAKGAREPVITLLELQHAPDFRRGICAEPINARSAGPVIAGRCLALPESSGKREFRAGLGRRFRSRRSIDD